VSFSFRIRFNRSPTDTVQTEANEIALSNDEAPFPLRLHNPETGGSILMATQLALTGDGYSSHEAAFAAGQKYQSALTVALARHRIGADFGLRAPKGFVTDHGLALFQQQLGQRVLNNVHGLMVFETEPRPRFALMNASPLRGVNQEAFMTVFSTAAAARTQLTERELVAFALFNASFFRQSADSRFLLLMMAIEALLEPCRRSDSARSHVDSLIQQTKNAELPQEDKASMIGSLRWLASESISQAGRNLSKSRLGERTYNEMSAAKFFTYCYSLRSALVHGSFPYPTLDQVSSTGGQLECFVSDLLTAPILGVPE
jgi:Apea-like HEPN